ncbi:secreted RxLR effector protein 161-like [Glycine max]|uniref:secreted RxLR effector protein 161-like n=1 Tax=Glycine max TaxID=3847 RepID=UPI0007191DAE|nr:secreted RxLR effector protein 161-like [Glycine max]
MECNYVITPTETGIKLQIDGDEKEVDPTLYKQIVGSLRYLCLTRPDIAYCVGLISRFMEKPKTPHFLVAKRILRYAKGTLDLGILYPYRQKSIEGEVFGYSDSNWCGDKDDRKSTVGYVFKFGTTPISWCSKKQSVVALSTCEAEYIVVAMAACQALWLEALTEELNERL